MKGSNESRRINIVRTALEALYVFMHFLAPGNHKQSIIQNILTLMQLIFAVAIPLAAQDVFLNLHTDPQSVNNLKDDFYNLQPGTTVTIGKILFQKIEVDESVVPRDMKIQVNKHSEDDKHQLDFTKLDLRVGCITKVWNHDNSNRLFCEDIDIGDSEPRKVVSALREYYTSDELIGKKVVVLCNLKEAKFQGVLSTAMVLAAKNSLGDKVELVHAPNECVVGERIFLDGYKDLSVTPWPSTKIKKFKVWEEVSSNFETDDKRHVCWKNLTLSTSCGPCIVPTLTYAKIQ